MDNQKNTDFVVSFEEYVTSKKIEVPEAFPKEIQTDTDNFEHLEKWVK